MCKINKIKEALTGGEGSAASLGGKSRTQTIKYNDEISQLATYQEQNLTTLQAGDAANFISNVFEVERAMFKHVDLTWLTTRFVQFTSNDMNAC